MVSVILGFPGVGKTTFTKTFGDTDPTVYDSDSSHFPKNNFPKNYVDYIEELIARSKEEQELDPRTTFIFCSTHYEVRLELDRRNISYFVVYPDISCKEEYLQRYRDRGSSENFIELLSDNWEQWITDLDRLPDNRRIKLTSGQYFKDAFVSGWCLSDFSG